MLLAVHMHSEEALHGVKAVCTLFILSCCPSVLVGSRLFIISNVLLQLDEAAVVKAALISLSYVDDVLAII